MHWKDWHYIIWNVKTTRWAKDQSNVKEIIEIGAVKLGPDLEILSTYHSYVRPLTNPILTPYCITTNQVTQEQVDNAPTFVQMYKEFMPWIGVGRIKMMSWGTRGKRYFFYNCQMYGKPFKWVNSNINLKNHFSRISDIDNPTLKTALDYYHIPYSNYKHSSLDMAQNVANLVTCMKDDLPFVRKQ